MENLHGTKKGVPQKQDPVNLVEPAPPGGTSEHNLHFLPPFTWIPAFLLGEGGGGLNAT